jgi:hypothetical protein
MHGIGHDSPSNLCISLRQRPSGHAATITREPQSLPDLATIDFMAMLPFVLVGFVAQLVDGALGMAFGVISSTLLGSVLGVPPAQVSASVHLAEVFTSGASGLSHAWLRNIDWRLFARLVIPGIIGGLIGVLALVNLDATTARPFIMGYLTIIGLSLLYRGWRYHAPAVTRPRVVAPLGLIGGFLDAAGGGGWGPVVTSNLLIQGADPRRVIGTVSASEFFLTASISLAFIGTLGLAAFTVATFGLLIGGLCAAPLAAFAAARVKPRVLLLLVGATISLTSAFALVRAF